MGEFNDLILEICTLARREFPREKVMLLLISNSYLYASDNDLIRNKDEALIVYAKSVNRNESIPERFNEIYKQLGFEGIKCLLYYLYSYKNRLVFSYDISSSYLSELALELLEIDENGNDTLMDFGSGIGYFLINAYNHMRNKDINLKHLYGIECDVEYAYMSMMALAIINDDEKCKDSIIIGDALDKIECSYTKGYLFSSMHNNEFYADKDLNSQLFPDLYLTKYNYPVWSFIDSMLANKSCKRSVALIAASALYNNSDLEYRNRLIKEGLLEGIIELPFGSLVYTGRKMCLLIFSKNNKEIKFVDASKVLIDDNRRFVNMELPIEAIKKMYYAKDVPTKKLNELIDVKNLIPSTVLLETKKLENAVKLSEVAECLFGSHYTIGIYERKGLLSDKKTDYRILTSSDIEQHITNWNQLHYIQNIKDKDEKNSLQYGDVIITTKSSKVKVSVVDFKPEEKIIVSAGLIIIRPNLEKINPLYLKIYLDSEAGQLELAKIQKGAAILNISREDLLKIEIPLIDMEKQVAKAKEYQKRLKDLIAYKLEIKKIEDSLKNIFEEEL